MTKNKNYLRGIVVILTIIALSPVTPVLASDSTVTQIQQKLEERGYDPGPIDGIMGKKTKSAIKKFQSDLGLESTGAINRVTLDKLDLSKLPVAKSKTSQRDGRFVAYANGTVKDTKTDLMWASKDNGEDINWKDAKRYCENYRGGGYMDWRMPTLDELTGLYDKSESYCPWASETRDSEAAYFYFHSGLRTWNSQSASYHYRALPVRSDK
jgi:peptidoglycan hydrolase-like protein with peptidoglycan-binding domain